MGLILDTSEVVAAERRGHSILQFLEHVKAICGETDLGLSVVTIAELVHGAYRAKSDPERNRRLAFIDRLCQDIPVYPVTLPIARNAGRIDGELASRGITLSFEDVTIGATALQLGFDVATVNIKHFKPIPGLTVISL